MGGRGAVYTGGQRIASKLYQTPYAMNCPGEAPNEPGEPSNKAEDPAPTSNYIWCQQPVVRTTDIVLAGFTEYVLSKFDGASVPQNPQLPAATPSELGSIAYAPCEELDWQNFNPEQQYEGGNLPYIDCLCRYNPEQAIALGINCQSYTQMYWYHPDYLGNTEFVTDAGGYPYQFFYYSAFGETLWQHDAQTGNFATPYKFNAKEQDTETGNYYYGARYYNPQTSIWFGVDAMANKYPDFSSYVFVANNPIMLTDPDGRQVFPVHGTWSDNGTWKQLKGITKASFNLFGDSKLGRSFQWSGGNYARSRTIAANDLIKQIQIERKNTDPSEPITLVGHSHGGNVAIEAINLMMEMEEFDGVEFNLLTINTPVRDDYQLTEKAASRVVHVNVYDQNDPVQSNGGNSVIVLPDIPSNNKGTGEFGPAGRTFEKANNIQVNNPQGLFMGLSFIPGVLIPIPIIGDIHNSHNRLNDWITKTEF